MQLTLLKEKVLEACKARLQTKLNDFDLALADLMQGASGDSKSSAGDKHETARAMMQMEYEKISNQKAECLLQFQQLNRIVPQTVQHINIKNGSLVKTNEAYLFLSVGIGMIEIASTQVMVLSPQSPLGLIMMNRRLGDTFEFNKKSYRIEAIA